MELVTNFARIKCQNIFSPKKRANYDNLCFFFTKQRKLYFHIINIHTQGHITLNKYIIGIAIIRLPKINLWAKTLFSSKHRIFRATIYPRK